MKFEEMTMWDALTIAKYRQCVGNIKQIINQNDSFTNVVKALLETTCKVLKTEIGIFWAYNHDGDGLIKALQVYGTGELDEIKFLANEDLIGEVMSDGLSKLVTEDLSNSKLIKYLEDRNDLEASSTICVPLNYKGLSFAGIQLISKADNTLFDESDLSFVNELSTTIVEDLIKSDLISNFLLNSTSETDSSFVNIGKTIDVVSMFIDIRGFTKIIGDAGAKNATSVLNAFLSYVTSIVDANNGYIDKYMGDKIMATWSAKTNDPLMIENALKTAEIINRNKSELKEKVKKEYDADINFSIGIAIGSVYAGTIGSVKKTSFTVVGDSVNIAHKLCNAAQINEILVTKEIVNGNTDKNFQFIQRNVNALYRDRSIDAYALKV